MNKRMPRFDFRRRALEAFFVMDRTLVGVRMATGDFPHLHKQSTHVRDPRAHESQSCNATPRFEC